MQHKSWQCDTDKLQPHIVGIRESLIHLPADIQIAERITVQQAHYLWLRWIREARDEFRFKSPPILFSCLASNDTGCNLAKFLASLSLQAIQVPDKVLYRRSSKEDEASKEFRMTHSKAQCDKATKGMTQHYRVLYAQLVAESCDIVGHNTHLVVFGTIASRTPFAPQIKIDDLGEFTEWVHRGTKVRMVNHSWATVKQNEDRVWNHPLFCWFKSTTNHIEKEMGAIHLQIHTLSPFLKGLC